ncbi:MAG: glycosyltransferase family 4 protein [Bacteroidales bacterium]|nr:glycosyltransferase family 4 protein [Bacteroidales bacterium]
MKKKVLIMAGHYIPSVKAGGPVQSIKNLVDNLSDEIDFYIVAADRDLGDDKPFSNIEKNKWIKVGKAEVFYTNLSKLKWSKVANIINAVPYDVLYLNSLFSYRTSILPLFLMKLRKISSRLIILAPRGELSPGALGLKKRKKMLFIKIAKLLGLHRQITWHATANLEKKHIEKTFGNDNQIVIAPNLTASYSNLEFDKNIPKQAGELKVIFISRIAPKKNLKTALELLRMVRGKIEFNIYGPVEDKSYWSECQDVMNDLGSHVSVSYCGVVAHNGVMNLFKEHHIFLFPTLGENFGHVISEALIGGCPVIISDQTPWRDLSSQQVGWDIALDDTEMFVRVLQKCIDMENGEYQNMSERAFEYCRTLTSSDSNVRGYHELFGLYTK